MIGLAREVGLHALVDGVWNEEVLASGERCVDMLPQEGSPGPRSQSAMGVALARFGRFSRRSGSRPCIAALSGAFEM